MFSFPWCNSCLFSFPILTLTAIKITLVFKGLVGYKMGGNLVDGTKSLKSVNAGFDLRDLDSMPSNYQLNNPMEGP